MNSFVALLVLAAAVDGLLAGASLDQSIKQLPARRRMGVPAFSVYSRAADLANGVWWYALLGVSGAVLTLAAAGAAIALALPIVQSAPLAIAMLLAIAHTFTTVRAAPINFSQRTVGDDEGALAAIFDRFERWQTVRAILQLATFLTVLWALAATASLGR
jgi:hypothetical protein